MGRSHLAVLLATFVIGVVGIGACKKSKPTATETQSESKGGQKEKGGGGSAAMERSRENLKQIGMAMSGYLSTNGHFPPATPLPGTKPSPIPIYGVHGWRVQLLPFMEQESLYRQIDRTSAVPASVRAKSILTYRSPLAGANETQTPYRAFVGNGAAFEYRRPMRAADFTDGLSNTILVVESAEPVDWADGPDIEYDPSKPLPKLGIFPGGFHALMADGSVRWISDGTDDSVIRAMITRSGSETFEAP